MFQISRKVLMPGMVAGTILIALTGLIALLMVTMTLPRLPGPVDLPETTAPGSSYADVMTFSAMGNGEHDDTEAFEAALATGLPAFVPASDEGFLITRTLRLHDGPEPPGCRWLSLTPALSNHRPLHNQRQRGQRQTTWLDRSRYRAVR